MRFSSTFSTYLLNWLIADVNHFFESWYGRLPLGSDGLNRTKCKKYKKLICEAFHKICHKPPSLHLAIYNEISIQEWHKTCPPNQVKL